MHFLKIAVRLVQRHVVDNDLKIGVEHARDQHMLQRLVHVGHGRTQLGQHRVITVRSVHLQRHQLIHHRGVSRTVGMQQQQMERVPVLMHVQQHFLHTVPADLPQALRLALDGQRRKR